METVKRIVSVARAWLKPRSPWMTRAKNEVTAFSPQMMELGLRELFEEIAANVETLARREAKTQSTVCETTVCHILSGNLPNAGIVSMVVGLLAGARNIVKPAVGDPMPRLFVESMGGGIKITNDREAFRRADIVVAYGTNETLMAIQNQMTKQQKFLGFGHRVSIGIVNSTQAAKAAARDVSMWDQQGCMSPQSLYVDGDTEEFATVLAREMEKFDRRWPRTELCFEDVAAIARVRHEWSFRGKIWASRGSTHWTVVLDKRSAWAASPLNRFVFVRPITALRKLPKDLHFSTIGFEENLGALVKAERLVPMGAMQRPSLLEPVSRPHVEELTDEK